jgi:hypothetical protein
MSINCHRLRLLPHTELPKTCHAEIFMGCDPTIAIVLPQRPTGFGM